MDYITIEAELNEGKLLNIGELYEAMGRVNDKRQERGKRYTLAILLLVVILAKLVGKIHPMGYLNGQK